MNRDEIRLGVVNTVVQPEAGVNGPAAHWNPSLAAVSLSAMNSLHSCTVIARSYELDSFGHLNHAVFLNYFEYARFETLAAGGFPPSVITARGEGVHVVRVEVDYRREVLMGAEVVISTGLQEIRNSSMTLRQSAHSPGQPDQVYAEATVVAVWIGPDRRPMRIPSDVRAALGCP